jgi:hypothetical protein
MEIEAERLKRSLKYQEIQRRITPKFKVDVYVENAYIRREYEAKISKYTTPEERIDFMNNQPMGDFTQPGVTCEYIVCLEIITRQFHENTPPPSSIHQLLTTVKQWLLKAKWNISTPEIKYYMWMCFCRLLTWTTIKNQLNSDYTIPDTPFPISKWPQFEAYMRLQDIASHWGTKVISSAFINYFDRLRIRIGVLSALKTTNPNVFNHIGYFKKADDGFFQAEGAWIRICMVICNDIARCIACCIDLCKRFKTREESDTIETEPFSQWLIGASKSDTRRIINRNFFIEFVALSLQPGDIELYRENIVSGNPIKGGKISVEPRTNPDIVFQQQREGIYNIIQKNSKRVEDLLTKPEVFPLKEEAIICGIIMLFSHNQQILSNIAFKPSYFQYIFHDSKQLVPEDVPIGSPSIVRIGGSFFVTYNESRYVYTDIKQAIRKWVEIHPAEIMKDLYKTIFIDGTFSIVLRH